MNTLFSVAGGTTPGRDHVGRGGLLVGRNNQDAYAWVFEGESIVAVVCDGCGSKPHSEVGAKLGAKLVTQLVAEKLRMGGEPTAESFWEDVRGESLSKLRQMAWQLSASDESFAIFADQYLTFTIVGVVVTPEETIVFSIGDGVYAINGEVQLLGPFRDNSPPYLIYGLVPSKLSGEARNMLKFRLDIRPTSEVRSLLIGTDGVTNLIEAEERYLPGVDEPVGSLSQFWMEERYFANRDAVRRRLALVNSEGQLFDAATRRFTTTSGHLPDDTTLVVIRRNA